MAKSIMFYRSFLLLVCILLLAPITISAAENDETAAASTADNESKECKEPGTCGESENASVVDNTSESQTPPSTTVTATTSPDGDRLITEEEIALHTGVGDDAIWLSILGKVYDVSTGETHYGAEKGSYKFYAGRDATPCFSSGKNTIEGAAEDVEEWPDIKLISMYEWSEFYATHETYVYLGVLAPSSYYDELGVQTKFRQDILARSLIAKYTADKERDIKKKERAAAREAKKKLKNKK